MNECVS